MDSRTAAEQWSIQIAALILGNSKTASPLAMALKILQMGMFTQASLMMGCLMVGEISFTAMVRASPGLLRTGGLKMIYGSLSFGQIIFQVNYLEIQIQLKNIHQRFKRSITREQKYLVKAKQQS